VESTEGLTTAWNAGKAQRLRWGIAEVPASGSKRSAGQTRFVCCAGFPAYLKWFSTPFAQLMAAYLHKCCAQRKGAVITATASHPKTFDARLPVSSVRSSFTLGLLGVLATK